MDRMSHMELATRIVTAGPTGTGQCKKPPAGNSGEFARILSRVLEEKKAGLEFSSHARRRMESRGIKLEAEEMERLAGAVEKARAKGARDTVVMLGDKAFVVSAENRVVVTVIDEASRRDNVFTNIDSLVFA